MLYQPWTGQNSRRSLVRLAALCLLLLPASGGAAELPATDDDFARSYRDYTAAHTDWLKAVKAEEGCRIQEALRLYGEAIDAAEDGLVASRRYAREHPEKMDRARYAAAINLHEIGNSLTAFNEIIKGWYPLERRPRSGVAEAYCTELEEIGRIQSPASLGPLPQALLDYYRGHALIGVQRFQEGIDSLAAFLGQQTGGEFIEQAELEKKKAEENLEKTAAGNANPRLATEMTGAPLSFTDKYAKCRSGQPAPALPPVYTFSLTTGLGYDDNILQVARGARRPEGALGKGAFFNETDLVLGAIWFPFVRPYAADGKPGAILADALALNYSLGASEYDGHSGSDVLSQTATATYLRAITPTLDLGLTLGDGWQRRDNRNLDNSLLARPSVNFQATDKLQLTAFYSFTWTDFYLRTTRVRNPDNGTHVASLQLSGVMYSGLSNATPAFWRGGFLPTGQLTLAASYQHEWTDALGIVSDRQRDDPLFKATLLLCKSQDNCSFLRSVTVNSSYELRRDVYAHPTVPGAAGGAPFDRRDHSHLYSVTLSIKMWYDERAGNRLEFIGDYKITKQDSNSAAVEYDDSRFLASLKYNF